MAEVHKVFVGCLPADITDEELKIVFSTYGDVTEIHILAGSASKSKTGHSCAFISYAKRESAEDAIQVLDNQYKIRTGGDEIVPIRVSWPTKKAAGFDGGKGKGSGKGKSGWNYSQGGQGTWQSGGAGSWGGGCQGGGGQGGGCQGAGCQGGGCQGGGCQSGSGQGGGCQGGGWQSGGGGGCQGGGWQSSGGTGGSWQSGGGGGCQSGGWQDNRNQSWSSTGWQENKQGHSGSSNHTAWNSGGGSKGWSDTGPGKQTGGGKGGDVVADGRCFVGNLPSDINEEALRYVFESYGKVETVHIMTGRSKSGQACAFVEYSKPEEAETAVITLHEKYEIRPGEGVIQVKHASDRPPKRPRPY